MGLYEIKCSECSNIHVWFSGDPDQRCPECKGGKKDAVFYIECLNQLLVGLEIQCIDEFMDKCTPDNCLKLGVAITKAFKEKLKITIGNA